MNAMPKLRPEPIPEDPYKAPPENETLRQYFERRGYVGTFDELSAWELQGLEEERRARAAIFEMAQTKPVVFGCNGKVYKRYPDGAIEPVRSSHE